MEANQQSDLRQKTERENLPQASDGFGTVPKVSANFRSVRNDSDAFRNVPQVSERKENHTLTVRETARMFEAAGVARTERSIINWCQFNAQGVARLDAYFDPNERKYFITPQSVELAIAEEKAKAAKIIESSEPVRTIPNESEKAQQTSEVGSEAGTGRIRELEKEVMDLKITNRGKDYFIERLQKERETHVEKLMTLSREVGELETRLLQLSEPPGQLRQVGDGVSSPQP
jgi:hypothetical protein